MIRREFLKTVGSLPFLGLLKPKKVDLPCPYKIWREDGIKKFEKLDDSFNEIKLCNMALEKIGSRPIKYGMPWTCHGCKHRTINNFKIRQTR